MAFDLREARRLHNRGSEHCSLASAHRGSRHAVLRRSRRFLRGPRGRRRHETSRARDGGQNPIDGVRPHSRGAGHVRGVRGSAGGQQAVQSVHGVRGRDVCDVSAARRRGAVSGGSGAVDSRWLRERGVRDRLADGDQEVHS